MYFSSSTLNLVYTAYSWNLRNCLLFITRWYFAFCVHAFPLEGGRFWIILSHHTYASLHCSLRWGRGGGWLTAKDLSLAFYSWPLFCEPSRWDAAKRRCNSREIRAHRSFRTMSRRKAFSRLLYQVMLLTALKSWIHSERSDSKSEEQDCIQSVFSRQQGVCFQASFGHINTSVIKAWDHEPVGVA